MGRKCVFLMYRVTDGDGRIRGSRERSFPDEVSARNFAEDNGLTGFFFRMNAGQWSLLGKTSRDIKPTSYEQLMIDAFAPME